MQISFGSVARMCCLWIIESGITIVETRSRGHCRLIWDKALFSSAAGCAQRMLAHTKPWRGNIRNSVTLDFLPGANGHTTSSICHLWSWDFIKVILTFRKCDVRCRDSRPAGEQTFLWYICKRKESGKWAQTNPLTTMYFSHTSTAFVQKRGRKVLKCKERKNWAAHLMLVDMFYQLVTLQSRPPFPVLHFNT